MIFMLALKLLNLLTIDNNSEVGMLKEDHDTTSLLNNLSLENQHQAFEKSFDHVTKQENPAYLFDQLKSEFFNEMLDDEETYNGASKKIESWLCQHSLDELKILNAQAKAHFLYQGITFAVYGEVEGTDRIIPFDLIPRIIAKHQWHKIEQGCAQRVQALNLFLDDIYHDQAILNEKIIPAEQVLTHEAYQPLMYRHDLKGKIYSQISGIDIVRDQHGEFFVLEDNLRTPSGVSYMLESRKISQKLLPDLCRNNQLLGIEQYPQLLKAMLEENAYVDKPFIVVLTPGRYNSAFYEHCFLAREMDVPLVTGSDLFVENNKVYVKTVWGKIGRAHV